MTVQTEGDTALRVPPRRAALAAGPAALVVNTRSRRGQEAFVQAREALAARGVELLACHALTRPERLGVVLEDALRAGARVLVVGGGDGTLGCAAGTLAQREAVLGVLPLGTGNDFARSLGIAPTVEAACDVIAAGHVARIDVALANGRAFLNAASLGVPAGVAERLTHRLKQRFGRLAYPVAALSQVWAQRPFHVRLRSDEETLELAVLQLVVGNGRYHGAGNMVAPDAALDDRRLDVYAIRGPSAERGRARTGRGHVEDMATLAQVGLRLRSGEHVEHPAVVSRRVRWLEVEARPSQRLNADGELVGRTPVRFELRPAALGVLAPPPAPVH